MSDICRVCGYTRSQVIADARAIGLRQQFESGIYTCCQITEWANEQWSAWFEAIQEDSMRVEDMSSQCEFDDGDAMFVPVRLRRQQVPWYRNPSDLR